MCQKTRDDVSHLPKMKLTNDAGQCDVYHWLSQTFDDNQMGAGQLNGACARKSAGKCWANHLQDDFARRDMFRFRSMDNVPGFIQCPVKNFSNLEFIIHYVKVKTVGAEISAFP
jgi:hypothetical protein